MRLSHIFEEPQARRSPVHSAPEDLGGPLEVLLLRGLDVRGQIGRCPFHDHGEPVLVAVHGKDGRERMDAVREATPCIWLAPSTAQPGHMEVGGMRADAGSREYLWKSVIVVVGKTS